MLKKGFIFLTLLCLLTTSLCIGIKASAKEENLDKQCQELVNYLNDNLGEFNYQYNLAHKEQNLKVNSIEGWTLTYIQDDEVYGLYVDFDSDNGYMVVSFDFVIYEIKTKGDLKYLKDVRFVYYNVVDGFSSADGQRYSSTYQSFESAEEVSYGANGQYGDGDGSIYDIDAYMADRYPSYVYEQTIDDPVSKYHNVPRSQYGTSYYVQYVSSDNGISYSVKPENNCAITAIYNSMKTWQKMGRYSNFPTYNVDMRNDIVYDSFYSQYGTGSGGTGIKSYWKKNSDSMLQHMPQLYRDARAYLYNNCGINPAKNVTAAQAKETMIYVASFYGYDISQAIAITNSFQDIKPSISLGRGVFMGVSNSSTYGNHAVNVVGYKKYHYTSGWWVFSEEKIAYFYLIDDGIKSEYVWYDPNRTSSARYEFIYV